MIPRWSGYSGPVLCLAQELNIAANNLPLYRDQLRTIIIARLTLEGDVDVAGDRGRHEAVADTEYPYSHLLKSSLSHTTPNPHSLHVVCLTERYGDGRSPVVPSR